MKKGKSGILIKGIIVLAFIALFAIPALAEGEGTKMDFGILSLLPPLLAILLAFLTKQVVVSLLLGIFIGAVMLENWNVFYGFLRTFDKFILGAVADSWHAGILIFTLSIGGMVGVMTKMGGMRAIADALAKKAKSAKSAQVATFIMGVAVFFDDYSNSLIVGPTMRPLCDKMRVSREKLSYIVDSTAAPVAGMALISTWVGYELGLIGDAFKGIGMEVNAYEIFLKSIPYRFYDIFALVMVFLVGFMLKDFGPMYQAEKRARLTGKTLADGAKPMASMDIEKEGLKEGLKCKISNALVPIIVLIVLGFAGLWYSGGGPSEPFTMEGIRTAFGNSDASIALLWSAVVASIVAIVMAVSQKIMTVNEAMDAWVEGFKSLTITAIILTLAWSLGSVTESVGAADFLIKAVTGTLPAAILPLLVFAISCLVSFATGTSWGTMAIMMPLAIPLANSFVTNGAPSALLISTLGSVLTGSIFGDHCSPISDTTIMSSMASACDHMDHVKTQMPYALVIAGISIVIGYIPAGLGLPAWVSLIIGIAVIWAMLKFFGKSTDIAILQRSEQGIDINS